MKHIECKKTIIKIIGAIGVITNFFKAYSLSLRSNLSLITECWKIVLVCAFFCHWHTISLIKSCLLTVIRIFIEKKLFLNRYTSSLSLSNYILTWIRFIAPTTVKILHFQSTLTKHVTLLHEVSEKFRNWSLTQVKPTHVISFSWFYLPLIYIFP